MRVNSQSDPGKVAGSIVGSIESGEEVKIQTIGSKCVYLAVKSVAIATGILKQKNIDVTCKVSTENRKSEDTEYVLVIISVKGAKNAAPTEDL